MFKLWLHASKQSVWRAKEEWLYQNAFNNHSYLMMISLFISFPPIYLHSKTMNRAQNRSLSTHIRWLPAVSRLA